MVQKILVYVSAAPGAGDEANTTLQRALFVPLRAHGYMCACAYACTVCALHVATYNACL